MTKATTQINITAKDSTAAAFASAKNNLSGFASSALEATSALNAIGAGAFVGSLAALTKNTIDAQDELFKLSQKTGIAVESLAGLEFAAEQSGVELEKVAKATRAFSLLVAESADSSSEAANKLQQLGLSYKDLKDLSPEKQLLALAEALSKFGKEDRAVALTATLGQKMADLIPLLSGGSKGLQELIDQGKKLNPVTEQSARQAEQFNDQLNLLNKSVSALGREFVQGMIPGLTAVSTKMVEVTQQSGFLAGALAGVKELFVQSFGNPKILGDVGQIRREIFKTQEVIAQMSTKKDSIFFDKNALAHEQEKLVQLQTDLQNAIVKSRDVVAVQDANTVATKKFAIALDEGNKQVTSRAAKVDSLAKKMNDQTRIEEEYVKLLVIERKAQQDLLRPYEQSAKSAEERLDAMRQESAAMSLSQTKQISLEHAIEETTIARLEEKRAITKESGAVAAIDKEIAARKQIIGVIQSSQANTNQLTQTTRTATDDVSQLWMQAGRNIQSSLANGIFNFFDDGLKGMVKNVISTVGRIASEFAALKLAQSIGLSSMFGGGVGGTGSTAGSIFDIASTGSNVMSMFSSGSKGLGSMIGRGASALGFSSFGAGASGAATAGVFGPGGAAFLAGPGTAIGGAAGAGAAAAEFGALATAGAGMAAVAGPLAALAAGFMGGKFIAGEKKIAGIGGTEAALIGTALGGPVGAVVAGSILALFGRGPFKFRQQSLQGTASSEGFDGDITNVERANGGLLRSNAHRSTTVQLTNEMQDTFDTAIGAYYKSAHNFAESLGLDVNLVDGFTKEFQIKSEKGKQLTGEAVTEMVAGIGDSLAQNLLPIVDTLKKAGENSFQALARLSGDFDALAEGAVNLGASMQYARDLLKSSTFEGREAFIKAAGGIDALAQKTKFFSETFLNDAEQLAPTAKKLSETMQGLGFSVDITGEQFKALVQSYGQVNGITEETLQTLLNIAPAYVASNNLLKVLEEGIINLGGSAEFARQAVSGLSVDTRIAYLDAAGGASQFATDTANFNNLFFTEAERMAPIIKFVEDGMTSLGFSANLTKEQFRDLVQTLLQSSSEADRLTGALLLQNNVKFATATDFKESTKQTTNQTNFADAFTGLQNSVDAERKRITNTYNAALGKVNDRISNLTDSLGKLNALSQSVKNALSVLSPISLQDARARITDAISAVKGGKSFDQNSIQEALAKISEKDTSGFSDRNSFLRDQAKSVSLVDQLSSVTDKQITTQESQLDVAISTRDQLDNGFDRQISALDQILVKAKEQVDATRGLSTVLESLATALGKFNNASVSAGGGTVTPGPEVVGGNSTITSNDIRGFVASHSPMEVYKEAIKRKVSKEQIAASGAYTMADIEKFLKDNGLASFDVGGMVPKTGLALIHKNERIVNPQQNDAIVKLLEKLVPGAAASKDLYQLLKNMTDDGLSLRMVAA